jgi:ParB-like chromosome segregation protein Spo0J
VAWEVGPDDYEVVDGFHRHKVGKLLGMNRLPIVTVNQDRVDRGDRIASTIRHNRARGKHEVAAMSEIVQELARRNWNNEKIGRELGMEPDEVLRLKQITGLAEMFADQEFSEAWEAD